MERKYTILKVRNGFTVRFEHEKDSYSEENRRVAHDLEEIIYLIREDLNDLPVIE